VPQSNASGQVVSYLFDFDRNTNTYGIPNLDPNYAPIGDGEPITAFFVNGNRKFVGKRNTIHQFELKPQQTVNSA
jgi:hypothetical protein